jgi:hypothetical protein
MTKVLIDREVVEECVTACGTLKGVLGNARILYQAEAITFDELDDVLATGIKDLSTTIERLAAITAAPTYNASDVCAPCWQRVHEQPLEPGSPPCECPCHGLAARNITPGALDRAGRQEP